MLQQLPQSLQQMEAKMQLVLQQRDEDRQLHEDLRSDLQKRDAELHLALAERDEALQISILQGLAVKFTNFTMQLVGHIGASVKAAVKEGLGLKKAAVQRKTTNSQHMPEDQRASAVQAGPLALALSTVALEFLPDLPFATWKKLRGSFGYHAKKERQRLHALGDQHPDYVEKPLLWAYTGATVEGGGARYVYLQPQRALLRRIFTAQIPTTSAQRATGAPRPTESLEQRAHRLNLSLTAAERGIQWPVHVAEHEPQWDEM